jgi:hypothetical protein
VKAESGVRRRLSLPAVEAALRGSQAALGHVPDRDPLDDRVVDNLLAGYAYVDGLAAADIDPFALGHLKHLLELNVLVLCGSNAERRAAYARHLEASERRFYGDEVNGVRNVVEWMADHTAAPAAERAAGAYARMLAWPQLFIEGNHRTGVLAMSSVLLRDGRPPFLLTPGNAAAYFEISAGLREIALHNPATRFRLSALSGRLAALLADDADRADLFG